MGENRPQLIKLIGIVELLRSIYSIIGGIMGVGILSLLFGSPVGLGFLGIWGTYLLKGINIIIGIVGFIGAIALIRFKPIGRRLVIFVAGAMIILSFIQLVLFLFSGSMSGSLIWSLFIIFPIIYYAAMIFYLMSSEVKDAFGIS